MTARIAKKRSPSISTIRLIRELYTWSTTTLEGAKQENYLTRLEMHGRTMIADGSRQILDLGSTADTGKSMARTLEAARATTRSPRRRKCLLVFERPAFFFEDQGGLIDGLVRQRAGDRREGSLHHRGLRPGSTVLHGVVITDVGHLDAAEL